MKKDPDPERDERLAALALVREHNKPLMNSALGLIARLPSGWRGQSEDIRELLETDPGFAPTSGGFYGAMVKDAEDLGLLKRTGRRVHMRRKGSHGRMTDQLERV